MGHHDLQFISLPVAFLSLTAFIVLTVNRQSRIPGAIGLLGSALLLSGTIRGEFFHDISSQIYLLIFGSAFLFGSGLMILKRRQA
jgi:hypothetical protein